jgi:predicted anti-sigma-YlaC factor YlaD
MTPELSSELVRLLGPGEAELGCDACFAELDRYVELELAGEDASRIVPGMRAHLRGCPACREEYDSLRALLASEPAHAEGKNP